MTLKPQDLVGAWTFADWTIASDDGRISRPFQPNPSGVIVYSADGIMSATIQAGNRHRFSSDNIRKQPVAEKAAAFDGCFHYAGTWSIYGQSVIHAVSMAVNPNMVGTEQVRRVALDGDVLVLSAEELLEDGRGTRHHALTWRRHRSPLGRPIP